MGVLFVRRQSRIRLDSSRYLLGFGIDITLLSCLLIVSRRSGNVISVNLFDTSRRGRINSIRIGGLVDVVIGCLAISFNFGQLGVLFVRRQSRIRLDSSVNLLRFGIHVTLLSYLLIVSRHSGNMIGINLLNTNCCCSIDGIRIHRLINVVIGTLAVVFNRCQLGGLFGRCQRRISLNGSGHLLGFDINVTLLGRFLTIR